MGYCLTTMEIALKLLTEEKDLIKIERDDTDAYENKRNSIKNVVRQTRQSIKIDRQSFSLNMDGNILEEVANNTFKQ